VSGEVESTSGAGGPEPTSIAPLRRYAVELTSQIEEIVDAAERAAIGIRREAAESAQAYLEDCRREADRLLDQHARRLVDVATTLRLESQRVREVAEATSATADAVLAVLDDRSSRIPSKPFAEPVATEPPPAAPQPAGQDAIPGSSPEKALPEAALLRVAQMAVAGRDREEIRTVVAREFGIADLNSIVDDILGPA
jgi:hypothetical protein